jgi:hypothetical protein
MTPAAAFKLFRLCLLCLMTASPPAIAATDILTTKKTAPVAANIPARSHAPAPEKRKNPASNILSTKSAPANPVTPPTPTPPAASPPTPAVVPPAAALAPVPPKSAPAPLHFVVTARMRGGQTILNFPYTSRTAAAVFERGRNIWVVFSQAADANIALLRTVVPRQVIDITQYNYPGYTVLRLTTDGTIHAIAHADKGTYGWDIALAPNGEVAPLDTPVAVDKTEHGNRLLLSVFDTAPALSFYDPTAGDRILVIPTFESGRGMTYARTFPEFYLPNTDQGVAVFSSLDDLSSTASRLGVGIESAQGLILSDVLPTLKENNAPAPGVTSSVMLPYDQWYVPPDKFYDTLHARVRALVDATKESRPQSLLSLATLYLGQGMGAEAIGYLALLQVNEPEFYKANHIALLMAAAQALEHRPYDVAQTLTAPELANFPEADLWREYAGLYTLAPSAAQKIIEGDKPVPPTPVLVTDDVADNAEMVEAAKSGEPVAPPSKPLMHYLKYNKIYIRYYPPRIRQLLANDAAEAYIANGLEEKALATYDTLNHDNILTPYQYRAEYAVALVNLKKKKLLDAQKALGKLMRQSQDPYIRARARYTEALLQMQHGDKTPDATADEIESIRISWRGDALERDMLHTLAKLYYGNKHYAAALRAMKAFVDGFPNDPEYLSISTEMSALFDDLYINGKADDLTPLESLALFYEFRDLTPIGPKGDGVIQHLADRLAAFDLIDRATQLLETQINYRLGGEERSRVGARLALLYLLNHQPQEAQKIIEITNFGGNSPDLQHQRMELSAQALSGMGRYEEALSMLSYDNSPSGDLLKLDILWAAKDWPNVINRAEDILAKRKDLTAPLTPGETDVLLKLALGYSFMGDYTQLRYLRDYYSGLLPDSEYRQIFNFITSDTAPIDNRDLGKLTDQINHTEGFLNSFKDKVAAGKLSETVK